MPGRMATAEETAAFREEIGGFWVVTMGAQARSLRPPAAHSPDVDPAMQATSPSVAGEPPESPEAGERADPRPE